MTTAQTRGAGRVRRRAAAVLAVVGALLHAGAARADAPPTEEEVDKRVLEAKAACDAKQVERGIELLRQLYDETHDPDHVAAQGFCLKLARQYAEAAVLFREYLRVAPDAKPEYRARIQQVLATVEEEARKASAATAAPPPTPAPPAPAAVDLNARAETPRSSHRLPLILAAGGAAGLAVGVVSWFMAGSALDDYKACDMVCDQGEINRRGDRVQTLDLVAAVSAAVGGALVAAGAITYLAGRPRDSQPAGATARSPRFFVSPRGHAVGLELHFQ